MSARSRLSALATERLARSLSGGVDPQRIRRLSVLSLLLASAVAVGVWVHLQGGDIFCSSDISHGANIRSALNIAMPAGPVAAMLVRLTRKRQRLLAVVFLLGAATLCVAVAYVAADSARYVALRSCGLIETTDTRLDDHLEYLYAVWLLPTGFLLWAAVVSWLGRGGVPSAAGGNRSHR
jgi:hypothetical protein